MAYRGIDSPYKPRVAIMTIGLLLTRMYKILTIPIIAPIKTSLKSKNFSIALYIKMSATRNKKSIFNSNLIAGKRTMNWLDTPNVYFIYVTSAARFNKEKANNPTKLI